MKTSHLLAQVCDDDLVLAVVRHSRGLLFVPLADLTLQLRVGRLQGAHLVQVHGQAVVEVLHGALLAAHQPAAAVASDRSHVETTVPEVAGRVGHLDISTPWAGVHAGRPPGGCEGGHRGQRPGGHSTEDGKGRHCAFCSERSPELSGDWQRRRWSRARQEPDFYSAGSGRGSKGGGKMLRSANRRRLLALTCAGVSLCLSLSVSHSHTHTPL